MEDRLNSKDFHCIASIKLAPRDETPGWYSILVAHGEIRKLLGETIHGRRRTIESHVHKILLIDGLFSKYSDGKYRDIIKASDGN
jgi:hypothetical protein